MLNSCKALLYSPFMDSRINEDTPVSALTWRCPWPAGSSDARLLFGSDFCYVPWGWQLDQDGVYTDLITRQHSSSPPRMPAIEENFTLKAIGGQLCLQEINAFAQRWRSILPSDLQIVVEEGLHGPRAAADLLILCGAGDDSTGHCNLDAALAASRIVSKYPAYNESPPRAVSKQLEVLSSSTWELLRLTKAFCLVLQDVDAETTASLTTEFKEAWTSARVEEHSLTVTRFISENQVWSAVRPLIEGFDHKSFSRKAVDVAEKYHTVVEAARQQLVKRSAQIPWRAEVVAVKWNQRLPHISRLSTL